MSLSFSFVYLGHGSLSLVLYCSGRISSHNPTSIYFSTFCLLSSQLALLGLTVAWSARTFLLSHSPTTYNTHTRFSFSHHHGLPPTVLSKHTHTGRKGQNPKRLRFLLLLGCGCAQKATPLGHHTHTNDLRCSPVIDPSKRKRTGRTRPTSLRFEVFSLLIKILRFIQSIPSIVDSYFSINPIVSHDDGHLYHQFHNSAPSLCHLVASSQFFSGGTNEQL